MRWVSGGFALILLCLSACGINATPSTATTTATNTPTIVGTWETELSGVIFDQSASPGQPIAGATITYDVLHSYFAGLQEGRLNQTKSDDRGEFSLIVMVHDTDSVRILVEAQGYTPYEERLTGFDLVAGKRFEIGLSP